MNNCTSRFVRALMAIPPVPPRSTRRQVLLRPSVLVRLGPIRRIGPRRTSTRNQLPPQFGVLLQNIFVAIERPPGHLAKERGAAGIHGVLRVSELVAVVLADPAVDALAGLVINGHRSNLRSGQGSGFRIPAFRLDLVLVVLEG